jgi:hypothetical protein
MLCCGRRTVGRIIGVKLGPGTGEGTTDLSSLSILGSAYGSRPLEGVDGLSIFSGERGAGDSRPLSIIKLRSLTDAGWRDCRRRCVVPLSNRSGDVSRRFVRWGIIALSRAFSVNAAWADWMALDVPALETTPGD